MKFLATFTFALALSTSVAFLTHNVWWGLLTVSTMGLIAAGHVDD